MLVAGLLQNPFEGALTDTAEITCENNACEHLADTVLRRSGLVKSGLGVRKIVFELIDRAAVGKGMDPRRTVITPHNLRFPRAVLRSFKRIREGGVLVLCRVGQDIGDGCTGELFVIKRQ